MATRSPFLRPSDFRTLANFDTSISNGEGLDFARFARPDDGRLVATGGGDVAIEAVVGEVDLATGEPFRPGTTPFEHLVPSLELNQWISPAIFAQYPSGTFLASSIQALVFLHAPNVSMAPELVRRFEDAIPGQDRFDIGCRSGH